MEPLRAGNPAAVQTKTSDLPPVQSAIRRVVRDVQLFIEAAMRAVPVELDHDLVALLEELQRPAKQAARELIVLELYRQGEVSSGRAAQLLGMERENFIRHASEQGIPYFQVEGEELKRELEAIKKL